MTNVWNNTTVTIWKSCAWLFLAVLVAGTSSAQNTNEPAAPAATEKRVLFSTAMTERQANDIIDIQLMDDETLVFDKAETYTLFDIGLKKPKKLVITAKRAVIEQSVTIRSFDLEKDTQRPLPVKAFDGPAATGTHGGDGGNCNAGGNGDPGVQGTDGSQGTDGFSASLLLLDIKELQGSGTLTILNTGSKGGQGQGGQVGGAGGTAGRGGNAVDHLLDCACGPAIAGQPGPAGAGGRGGKGGIGGNAQTVLLTANLKSLVDGGKLVKVDVSGGPGGDPGAGAAGGTGGFGNEGGSGSANCNAGAQGSANGPGRTTEIAGNLGQGDKGKSAQIRTLDKSHWDSPIAPAK
jgi:hypothetical protein